jgi:hypothetical protein
MLLSQVKGCMGIPQLFIVLIIPVAPASRIVETTKAWGERKWRLFHEDFVIKEMAVLFS